MIFTANDYATLRHLTFRDDYPGYKPSVIESPNGDGVLDVGKSYAHVADKYLPECIDADPEARQLFYYNYTAWRRASVVASQMDLSCKFWPYFTCGALRILHYPAGTTSARHTDFDLFTINCYRNVANPGLPSIEVHMGELGELLGLGSATPHEVRAMDVEQESIVYFAIPDHRAVLPGGGTVGEWIAERMKRSRYDAK